jgi:hypothetical protein
MSRRFIAHHGKVPPSTKAAPRPGARPSVANPTVVRAKVASQPREVGGPAGPEPTRYGDWERKGICVDF